MCERFHCLPSAVLAEDARLLRWLEIRRRGGGDPGERAGDAGVPDLAGFPGV